jgi:MHS family proline/betaine transporter-like MFS transporter
LAVVGLWIRSHNEEADHPNLKAASGPSPLAQAVKGHKMDVLKIVLLNVMPAIGFYTIFVYLVTYLQEVDHLQAGKALEINTVSMVALLVLMPVFGWVADKVGPLKLMWASTLGILFCAYPLFSLMHHHDAWVDLLAELGFVLLLVPFMASSPAGLCALLPKGVRCTVLSVGFNLSMGLLGGTTPLVVEYMRKTTHQDMTPALYLVAGAVVTVFGLLLYREADGEHG